MKLPSAVAFIVSFDTDPFLGRLGRHDSIRVRLAESFGCYEVSDHNCHFVCAAGVTTNPAIDVTNVSTVASLMKRMLIDCLVPQYRIHAAVPANVYGTKPEIEYGWKKIEELKRNGEVPSDAPVVIFSARGHFWRIGYILRCYIGDMTYWKLRREGKLVFKRVKRLPLTQIFIREPGALVMLLLFGVETTRQLPKWIRRFAFGP